MALQANNPLFVAKSESPLASPFLSSSSSSRRMRLSYTGRARRRRVEGARLIHAVGGTNGVYASTGADGGGVVNKKSSSSVPNSNYVVPLDKSLASTYTSCITRPLAEILRDLNKKIPDNIVKPQSSSNLIPWYQANRMLSFYAPGWCGEIRDVIFSDNGSVTVVYRVTIRGSDAEAHRESTGTISPSDGHTEDPVAAAEEIAFCRACARFGLGLYLFHEE